MRVKKSTPFEEAFEKVFAQQAAEQAERLRKEQLVKFTRVIINLRKQATDESGIHDLGSQGFLRTGTFNN